MGIEGMGLEGRGIYGGGRASIRPIICFISFIMEFVMKVFSD